MNRAWGRGNERRGVYVYKNEDRYRMGNCRWLPSNGDLCICVEHTGDCFDSYIAIRKQEDGAYKMVGEFSAYVFGELVTKLDKREFHLLQAGEPVLLDI